MDFPTRCPPGDHAWTTPAVANGIVYFGVNRPIPVVYAVDAATGQEIWEHVGTISNIVSSPALLDGRLYVAFTDGTIRALDATNGQVIWSVIQPGGANSSPAVADGRPVYRNPQPRAARSQRQDRRRPSGWLPCPDRNGPRPLWITDGSSSAPAMTTSCMPSTQSPEQTLWTATTSDWVQTSPAVANGVVYIGNNAGNVYAFNAATGGLIWQRAVSPGLRHRGLTDGGQRRCLRRLRTRRFGNTIRREALRAQCCYRPGAV